MGHDELWIREPRIVFQGTRLLEFWPTRSMTQIERHNCYLRFALYATIVGAVLTRNPIYISLGMAAVLALAYSALALPSREPFTEPPHAASNEFEYARSKIDCQYPSDTNPFGNMLPGDPMDRKPACLYDEVADDINRRFDRSMCTNVTDVFNKENSQRQFYTMPNTAAANDQMEFARFLFGQGPNCKSDPNACTGYDRGPKSNVPPPNMTYVQ